MYLDLDLSFNVPIQAFRQQLVFRPVNVSCRTHRHRCCLVELWWLKLEMSVAGHNWRDRTEANHE